MAVYEDNKYIVVPMKHFHNLSLSDRNELRAIVKKIATPNKYFVCNQDEPYAEEVIKIILEGESKKEEERDGLSRAGE